MIKLAIFLLLFLSGCRIREIEDYAIISGVGLEYKNEEYNLHIEVLKSKGSSTNINSEFYQSKGKSINEAFFNVNYLMKEIPLYSHCGIILLDQGLKREDILNVFKYLVHDNDFRLSIIPVIALSPIEEILKENDSSKYILEMLKNNKHCINVVNYLELYECYDYLLYDDVSVLLPVCYYDEALKFDGGVLLNDFEIKEFYEKDEINTIKILNNKLSKGNFNLGGYDFYIINISSKLKLEKNKASFKIDACINSNTTVLEEEIIKEVFLDYLLKNELKIRKKNYDPFYLNLLCYRKNLELNRNYEIKIKLDVLIKKGA